MKLLVATGGTEHATPALRLTAYLMQLFDAEATVLTVVKSADQEQYAQQILQEASSMIGAVGPMLRARIRIGPAADEIISEATDGAYDLLILGSRPHHAWRVRLLGRTAFRIIAGSPCPVLIAKVDGQDVRRLLVCDGGADAPTIMDRLASRLPLLLDAATTVNVLHVMSQMSAGPGVEGSQLEANSSELIEVQSPEGELLSHDLEVLDQVDVQARPKIRHGLVVDEILAEAASSEYDLLVIGAHQSEGWLPFLLEDISEHIVAKTDRSVLVIP